MELDKDCIEAINNLCGDLDNMGFKISPSEDIYYYNSVDNKYILLHFKNWHTKEYIDVDYKSTLKVFVCPEAVYKNGWEKEALCCLSDKNALFNQYVRYDEENDRWYGVFSTYPYGTGRRKNWFPKFNIVFRYGNDSCYVEYRNTFMRHYARCSLARNELLFVIDGKVVDSKLVSFPLTGRRAVSIGILKEVYRYDQKSFDAWCQKIITEFDLHSHLEWLSKILEIPVPLLELQNELNETKAARAFPIQIEKNNLAMYEKISRLVKSFEVDTDKKIPLLTILGPAGVGKTTIAKILAEKFDAAIELVSPADLKGAYTGQTQAKIYDLFKRIIDETVTSPRSGIVILIDEVYTLLGDEFGREAVSLLLPILSGDRSELTRGKDDEEDKFPAIDLKKNKITIWFSGYELPTRQMLQKNLGLYRRMEILSLKTPTVDRLMDEFLKQIDDLTTPENEEIVIKKVRDHVAWATSPERAVYFANYSGIRRLAKEICALSGEDSDFLEQVDSVIAGSKNEIEAQYRAAILMNNDGKKDPTVPVPAFKTLSNISEVKVIGNQNVVEKMHEIVNMFFNKEEYIRQGIEIPKGMLFVGPPGTGKSYMAKHMAWYLQDKYRRTADKDHRVGFIPIVATKLHKAEDVDKLFETAKEFDDCIIFIDEIDAIGKKREENRFEDAMFSLMTNMDGFDSSSGIFILAATNAPEDLDQALMRAGRFDSVIEIAHPDKDDRKELIKYYLSEKKRWKDDYSSGEDGYKAEVESLIDDLARKTPFFSAAQIKTMVNNAAKVIEKSVEPGIEKKIDLEEWKSTLMDQIDTISLGEKGEVTDTTFDLTKNEGASGTAIHEVGHALMEYLEFDQQPFDEITVIPRGKALGYVRNYGRTNHPMTRENLLKDIRISLGGRVAEELVYGKDKVSAGSVADITDASSIAIDMVSKYGMSEAIGPMTLIVDHDKYLGNKAEYICSDAMRVQAENEEQSIIKEQYAITKEKLSNNKDLLIKLAREVFDKKTMTGEDFVEKIEKIKTGATIDIDLLRPES